MENWENKIIAEKLDSLKQLPKGYMPNLISKWEIIEAGLPKQKKRIPLFIWAVAASIIVAVFYTSVFFFSTKNKQVAVQLPVHKTTTPAVASALNKQPTSGIRTAQKVVIKSTKPIILDNNKILWAKKENKKMLIEAAVPILNNTNIDTTNHLSTITKTTFVAAAKVEINKSVKRKIFQKDFVDEVLTMDKTNATQNQKASFKIQFNKITVGENGQSSPALQWTKSF